MFKLDFLQATEAWRPDTGTVSSFYGQFRACRIHGFARLVRLVTFGGQAPEGQLFGSNRSDGSFWFAEEDFLRLKSQAEADLRMQGSSSRQIRHRLGVYLRHQFRYLLAIRRDWTPCFDRYVILSVPTGESVIALVGQIHTQPVYSPEFPGEASARSAGLRLVGGLMQYVIKFDFPANKKARVWIQPPKQF